MMILRTSVILLAVAFLCGCRGESPEAAALRRHIEALSGTDVGGRIAAAAELGRLRATNAVPRLMLAADDVRPDVRGAVVEALVLIGDPRARDVFVRHLKSREWRTRQLAAQGLGRLGDASVGQQLREAMRDEHVAVAAAAAVALAACAGADAVRAVAESRTEPVTARESALLALAELGAGRDAVLAVARDTNVAVRIAAFGALARCAKPGDVDLLVEGLLDKDAGVRASCEKSLMAMEPDTVLPFLLAAMNGASIEKQTAILAMAASDRTARGIAVLAAALVSENAAVQRRGNAILDDRKRALARAGQDTRILPADVLLRAMSSTNEAVRSAALVHVERDAVLGRSSEQVVSAALKDGSAAVRIVAVRILDRIAPEALVSNVTPLLDDPDAEVRLVAATRLVVTNDLAVAVVADALEREVAGMRADEKEQLAKIRIERIEEMAVALGKSRSPKAVPAILKCLEALKTGPALISSIRALGMTGDRTVYDKVTPYFGGMTWNDQLLRNAAIEAMGSLDPGRAAEDLLPLLADTTKWQAESSIAAMCRILAKLKEPRAAEPMIDRLRERYEKESGRLSEVRLAAAAGLVDLGGVAVPAIVRRLGDAKVREGALAMILGRIGEPALGPAVEAMKSPDALARKNAAWALGYMRARPDSVGALCAALADGDTGVRTAAAWSLGNLRVKESLADLRSMLASADSRDRVAAAEALGRIGDAAAAQDLIARLQDADPDVRFAAVTSLGALGDKSAIVPLRSLMVREYEKRNERLKFAAGEALNALGADAADGKPR